MACEVRLKITDGGILKTLKNISTSFLLLCSFAVSSGCGSAFHEAPKSTGGPNGPSKPDGSNNGFEANATLGFETVQVIFQHGRCLNCHSGDAIGGGGIAFDTYAETKPLAKLIAMDMKSGRMPFDDGPKVSAYDQAVYAAWLAEGTPETSDKPIPVKTEGFGHLIGANNALSLVAAVLPPADQLDFGDMKQYIFEPYCVGCHTRYTEYSEVVNDINQIYDQVSSGAMPLVDGPLSPELQQALRDWITHGKPENL